MLERFTNYIKNQALTEPEHKILLAVSGGIDSMVMTDLFARSGYECIIAHCQFNLRGEESDRDESFVRETATAYNFPVFVRSFDTQKEASEKGISIQMAARNLRYTWFKQLLLDEDCQLIATAHHLGDLAETMLLNLARGTGISGLHGIPAHHGNIIRPLLFATRSEVEAYAREQNLSWRDDSSNADTKYKRNEIRHKVIPVLKGQNPNLEARMAISSEKLAGAEAIMLAYVREFAGKHSSEVDGAYILSLSPLFNSPSPIFLLYELIKPFGFTYKQAGDILGHANSESGRYTDAIDYRAYREREAVVIVSRNRDNVEGGFINEEEGTTVTAGYTWQTDSFSAAEFEISKDRMVATLDKSKLHFPLKIRTWKQGDRFFPLGMNQQKKLSDFMIDEKIPLYLKDRVRVVCSGEDIVWVAGYRIDHRYRITEHTQEVFRIGIL